MLKITELGIDGGLFFQDIVFHGDAKELEFKINNESTISFFREDESQLFVNGYKISYVVLDKPPSEVKNSKVIRVNFC